MGSWDDFKQTLCFGWVYSKRNQFEQEHAMLGITYSEPGL